MGDPFRDELAAAHQRIEKLEGEHAERVAKLERENVRLRERLVEVAPSRTKTGRTFATIGVLTLGVSLMAGAFFARMTARSASVPMASIGPIELIQSPAIEVTDDPLATVDDFDRDGARVTLANVRVDDCGNRAGPHGEGHVKITFAPSGLVRDAVVDQPPFKGTSTASCVETRFRNARMHTFTGAARTLGKTFVIP